MLTSSYVYYKSSLVSISTYRKNVTEDWTLINKYGLIKPNKPSVNMIHITRPNGVLVVQLKQLYLVSQNQRGGNCYFQV